jgi:hypothetical protein
MHYLDASGKRTYTLKVRTELQWHQATYRSDHPFIWRPSLRSSSRSMLFFYLYTIVSNILYLFASSTVWFDRRIIRKEKWRRVPTQPVFPPMTNSADNVLPPRSALECTYQIFPETRNYKE